MVEPRAAQAAPKEDILPFSAFWNIFPKVCEHMYPNLLICTKPHLNVR